MREQLWHSRGRAQQLAVLPFHRFIAFAGALAETLDIQYLNFTARVPDHPGFLKSAGNRGHAGALDAQHLRQKFLRKWKVIASRQVSRAQHPPTKTSINFMVCHAGRRLLGLGEERLLVPHDS